MSASAPCHHCSKTVYVTEKIEASHKTFHKSCFRCSEPGCVVTLNLKNFEIVHDVLFCNKHTPKPKATVVTESLHFMHSVNAPKKQSEGLHKTQLGSGESISLSLDAISVKHAINAPKKPSENLGYIQKGEVSPHSSNESIVQAISVAKAL